MKATKLVKAQQAQGGSKMR